MADLSLQKEFACLLREAESCGNNVSSTAEAVSSARESIGFLL